MRLKDENADLKRRLEELEEKHKLFKYKVGVTLLYPKIGENRSSGSEFKELCLMLCSPLNRKTMGISIHVRGITK